MNPHHTALPAVTWSTERFVRAGFRRTCACDHMTCRTGLTCVWHVTPIKESNLLHQNPKVCIVFPHRSISSNTVSEDHRFMLVDFRNRIYNVTVHFRGHLRLFVAMGPELPRQGYTVLHEDRTHTADPPCYWNGAATDNLRTNPPPQSHFRDFHWAP